MFRFLALIFALLQFFVGFRFGGKTDDIYVPTDSAPADSIPAEEAPAADAPYDLYESILARGELRVSICPDYAPMEFIDTTKSGQDQYVGFDVFLAQYIADWMDVELVIEAMSFADCQDAVLYGEVDMSINAYAYTDERAERFTLSNEYYASEENNSLVILMPEGEYNLAAIVNVILDDVQYSGIYEYWYDEAYGLSMKATSEELAIPDR